MLINRSRVEERKADLERLERRIFQSGRPVHQQSTSTESPKTTQPHEISNIMETLEKAFSTLKEATGIQLYINNRVVHTHHSFWEVYIQTFISISANV